MTTNNLDTLLTDIGLSGRARWAMVERFGEACTVEKLQELSDKHGGIDGEPYIGTKIIDELVDRIAPFGLTVVKMRRPSGEWRFRVANYVEATELKFKRGENYTTIRPTVWLSELEDISIALVEYGRSSRDSPLRLVEVNESSHGSLESFNLVLEVDYSRIDVPTRRLIDRIYPPAMSIKLAELDISYRARKGLGMVVLYNPPKWGYQWKHWDEGLQVSIGEFSARYSPTDIVNERNMGPKSLSEIISACKRLGARLWGMRPEETQ